MRTREVPRDEWVPFCEQFSRIHHRKPVGMTERELGVVAQRAGPEAEMLPPGVILDGIVLP
jgi:hypothetical protein